ncbi:hypothetical protein O181_005721 [Austropuccinia psidii MF-1]|uniref:Uncharacterized protein n=1 Tax=Austropuccinia psidii MF-1 TaxID=1389203 RepID=A0A9Q3BHT0_9BASI|nr:hypothetical protein [Austropuccinia psidii MF-1]
MISLENSSHYIPAVHNTVTPQEPAVPLRGFNSPSHAASLTKPNVTLAGQSLANWAGVIARLLQSSQLFSQSGSPSDGSPPSLARRRNCELGNNNVGTPS